MADNGGKHLLALVPFEALDEMTDEQRDYFFAQLAHDAIVAANKILAAEGKPLFEVTPLEEVIAHLRHKREEEY